MTLRKIEVVLKKDVAPDLEHVFDQLPIVDYWLEKGTDSQVKRFSLLVHLDKTQEVMDALILRLGEGDDVRMVISPVAATIPKVELDEVEQKEEEKTTVQFAGMSREELYDTVAGGATLDSHYFLLIIFSTIVAAIGILERSSIIIIGSALIAPLLGPNLALALATTLGDIKLVYRSIRANLFGLISCILFSMLIGVFWRYAFHHISIATHVRVSYANIILASASGAAAALSLLTGMSGTLVGVMVAVALLPPTVKVGLALTFQHYSLALIAFALLLVNIVCINLSANLVFWFKGVRPSRWYEKQKAKRMNAWFFLCFFFALASLVVLIYFFGESLIR